MTVFIEIANTQKAEGEFQEITDSVKGELLSDENGFTLNYADKMLGGNTTVTVSGGDFVSVIRTSSDFDTEMFFETGKTRPLVYNTPYGEVLLETDTHSITSLVEENRGFVEFEYDLLSGGTVQSHNRMRIDFSEEKDV